jgi:hypothetical protein
MTDRVRIIKHEAVPDCGSFEVRFPDIEPKGTAAASAVAIDHLLQGWTT